MYNAETLRKQKSEYNRERLQKLENSTNERFREAFRQIKAYFPEFVRSPGDFPASVSALINETFIKNVCGSKADEFYMM